MRIGNLDAISINSLKIEQISQGHKDQPGGLHWGHEYVSS